MTFEERCLVVEECYELMVRYAAQAWPGEEATDISTLLRNAADSVRGLPDSFVESVRNSQPAEAYSSFGNVLRRDAEDTLALLEIVLAQPTINAQMIENLKSSTHVRALLFDLFLMTDILHVQNRTAAPATAYKQKET